MGIQCSAEVCLLKQEEDSEMKICAGKDLDTDSTEGVAHAKVKHCSAGHVLQPSTDVTGECGDCRSIFKDGVTVMRCVQCKFSRCEVCYPLKALEVGDIVRAMDASKGFVNSEGVEVYRVGDEGRVRKSFRLDGQSRLKIGWKRTGLTTTCPASKWPSRFSLVCRADNTAEMAEEKAARRTEEKAARRTAQSVLALVTSGAPIPEVLPTTGVTKDTDAVQAVELAATAAGKNPETLQDVSDASQAGCKSLGKPVPASAARVAPSEAPTAASAASAPPQAVDELTVQEKPQSSFVDFEEQTFTAIVPVQVVDVHGAPTKEVLESAQFDLHLKNPDLTQSAPDMDQGSTQAESELEDPMQSEKQRVVLIHFDDKVSFGDFRGAPRHFWNKLHLRFVPAFAAEEVFPAAGSDARGDDAVKICDSGLGDLIADAIEGTPLVADDSYLLNFTKPSRIKASAADAEAISPQAGTSHLSFTKPSKTEAIAVEVKVKEFPDCMTEFQSAPYESTLVEDCAKVSECFVDDESSKASDSVLLAEAPWVSNTCQKAAALPWNLRPSVGTWLGTHSLIE